MRATILAFWISFLAVSLITRYSIPANAAVSVHHKGNTPRSSSPDRSIHRHGQDRKDDHCPTVKKQHVKKRPKSLSEPPKPITPRPRSFRNSIYRYKDKIYIGREDWYSAYRRNRGPNGVMRKLILESNRRKKASVIFPLVPSEMEGQDTMGSSDRSVNVGNDTKDDYSSMEHRFGRARMTDDDLSSSIPGSNSASKNVTSSRSDEDDDKDDDDDDDDDADRQESIQGVRKHKVVKVPVPVNIEPVGLIPKSRSGGHRSYSLLVDDGPNRVQVLVLQGIWMVSVGLMVDSVMG